MLIHLDFVDTPVNLNTPCIRWVRRIQNGAIGGHGAANGRLCHPPWSILRGPKIDRFSKPPRVAKKSMDVRLGAVRGVKFFPGGSSAARQRLGGGVRFEKGVPRAALVRARLINKLIKFREFIIFKIFRRIKGVRSNTPWA